MINTDEKLNEIVDILLSNPSILIQSDTNEISNYISFLEGFFISLKVNNEIDYERKISKWYQEKVDFKAPNMNWFAQFKLINKEESEEKMISGLLNEIKLFLA